LLTEEISYRAGMLRAKHWEKVPWGDCVVAATVAQNKAKFVVTEESHFASVGEVEARGISKLRL
jgi:predicted nucleic acid-binding protein